MCSFILPCQIQISRWRRPRLLKDAMQENHSLFSIHAEEDTSNTIAAQFCPNLMETISHWTADSHSDGPPKFDRLDILSDQVSILCSH